jgi:hypothetical protein
MDICVARAIIHCAWFWDYCIQTRLASSSQKSSPKDISCFMVASLLLKTIMWLADSQNKLNI